MCAVTNIRLSEPTNIQINYISFYRNGYVFVLRKCINFILRNTLGKMLGEKAQSSACREIIQIVIKQMNSIDFNPENAKDCNQVYIVTIVYGL